jgi:hypothetical protein
MAIAVISTIISMILMTLVSIIFVAITMTFLIAGSIFSVVPIIVYKVDTLSTSIVLAAMSTPVFGMPRGNT